MTIRVEPGEYYLATRVGRSVVLRSVVLDSVQVQNRLPTPPPPVATLDITGSRLDGGWEVVSEHLLVTRQGVLVEFRYSEQASDSAPIGSIRVMYRAEFEMPSDPLEDIGEEALAAFARLGGLKVLWPYLRATVERLSLDARMQCTLPLLRVESKEESDESGSVP